MKKELKSSTLLHSDTSILTVYPSDATEAFSDDMYDEEAKQILEFLTETFATRTLYRLSSQLKKSIVDATAMVFIKDGDCLVQINPENGKPSSVFKKV